jgi:hypothetical protein
VNLKKADACKSLPGEAVHSRPRHNAIHPDEALPNPVAMTGKVLQNNNPNGNF